MEIIFAKLPKYLDHISILIGKFGYQVFYLELSSRRGDTNENEDRRINNLKTHHIVPLPIEDLPCFKGISEINSDPDKKTFKKAQQLAPLNLLTAFGKLFPNTTKVTNKLLIAVHSAITPQMVYVAGKVNIWAEANRDRDYLLIDVSPEGFLTPELAPNVRLLVIPLDIFAKGLDKIVHIVHTFLHLLPEKFTFDKKPECPTDMYKRDINPSRIAFVTHKGLSYGNLFQKNLFYSTITDSELFPERLLHFDYSGVASPSEKLQWVCLGNHRQSVISNLFFAFKAIHKGILHIHHFRHIVGLLILTRTYIIFRSYSTKLESYPNLKIALIDYEILCPKELLLAFESKGIKTVATQERFYFAFNNLFGSTILSSYLCSSQYAADSMKLSPLYSINHFLPVGQYRSDNLLIAKKSQPPQVLEAPIAKGRKIITALGFHTHMEWQKSQTDPLLNWKAHKNFLDNMIRLSSEIPDVFIVLRYKNVDWISLPAFAEAVQKINSCDSITISTDYNKALVSYDLCAHSDLVIAKPTSIVDECLSVGIPVLIYEYSHNTQRIIADIIDYSPSKIMCFNYQELLERAKIILSGTPNAMTKDYEYLKDVVYGGLGDGKVKERIHAYIEQILSKL